MILAELVRPGEGTITWGGGRTWGSGTWGEVADAVYQLPEGLFIRDRSFQQRVKTEDRPFADGRFSYGDALDDRELKLEGLVDAESEPEMEALMRTMRYQCQLPNQRLRINVDGVPGAFFMPLAKLKQFEEEPQEGFRLEVSRCRIAWQVDDPFWYSEDLQTRTISLSGDGTFTVDLSGLPKNFRGQHPQITVTAPIFLPVSTFTLTNNSDGGLQMRYGDPYLAYGASATIDCAKGTVKRNDGENTIRYLQGEFLRLVSGANSFAYSGPACTLVFSWRHRWL